MPPSKTPISSLAAAIALWCATGAAMAQTVTPDQPVPAPAPAATASAADAEALVHLAFNRFDVNKDGKLSPDEAAALPAVAAKFTQLDVNHDGVISEAEFVAGVRIGN